MSKIERLTINIRAIVKAVREHNSEVIRFNCKRVIETIIERRKA